MSSRLIKGGSIVTEEGVLRNDILTENGIVKSMNEEIVQQADEEIDATNHYIFPGFIDCHVHFREPGNEDAEDLESGGKAARSGGVTTVCEMPNTNPPICTVAALEDKLERVKRVKDCDIRFFFNVSKAAHLNELAQVNTDDICGVKIYFDHSTGNLGADQSVFEDVFKICSERKIPLVAHCEDAAINADLQAKITRSDVAVHSEIRPPESEAKAIDDAITLAKKYDTQFHVAHLSTKQGLELVRQAKNDALDVTCEVTPHHLFLNTGDYEHLGTFAKMNPPLRSPDHNEALWQGVCDGTVDCIATDHAPHTIASKTACHAEELAEGERLEAPLDAPSGVPGVETMIPLLLSCVFSDGPKDHRGEVRPVGARHALPLQVNDILRLCFTNPNQIFGLQKGKIEIGNAVNLTIIDPQTIKKITASKLHSKCGWTPYEGWQVVGNIKVIN